MHAHRLVTLTTALLCLVATAGAADLPGGWQLRESPARSMLYAIDFADDDHGWAVGLHAIVATANGGLTWTRQSWAGDGGAYWFNSVAAIDAERAVIAAHPYGRKDQDASGALLLTTDGGRSWRNVAPDAEGARYNAVVFRAGGQVGYALSTRQGLLRSADGGVSWQRVDIGTQAPGSHITLRELICLPDEQTVIIPGREVLAVSRDDGASWSHLPFPEEAERPHRWLFSWAAFATAERGWVQLYGGDRLDTTDGGATWTIAEGSGPIWVQDEQRVWRTSTYEVFTSDDQGETWSDPVRIGGQWDRIHALAFTGDKVHMAGGDEGHGHPFLADRKLDLSGQSLVTLPEGVVDIPFEMPADGIATVQILDRNGQIVKHLINGVPLPKGPVELKWDLSTVFDYWPPFRKTDDVLYSPPASAEPLADPGSYTWRALYHPPLSLEHKGSYYPLGVHGTPWLNPERTGGWLADHEPPRCLVAADGRMWLGTFCEGGDCLIETDLEMRKLWGENRMFLTNPQALAAAGEHVWFMEAGGWGEGLRMVRTHRATKRSEHLIQAKVAKDDPTDISGLAVVGDRAVVAFHDGPDLLVLDLAPNLAGTDQDLHVLHRISAQRAGTIRPYRDGRLAVVVDGTVSLLDLGTRRVEPVVTGLTNPMGLAVDGEGRFYVGEMDPLHQVVVYGPDGTRQRVIGKRGGHPLGPFDRDNLESPRGVEVDADGRVWVTEWNHELKRVSVWDQRGRCVDQVLGPTVYGGGGSIDPADADRLFYRGKEFRRDPETGEVRLVNIIWRRDDPNVDEFGGKRSHNFGGNAPSAPFHRGDKTFFRLWGGHDMGDISVLFVYDVDRVRPVAAVGRMPAWLQRRMGLGGERPAFAWTDRNEDGRAQASEVQTGPIAGSCTWGTRMNESFEVAFSTTNGELGFSFFRVDSLTEHGYPVYAMPERFEMVAGYRTGDPCQIQGMMTDAEGNAVSLGPYVMSVAPDGSVNWRYVSRWPSLHAGYRTTAAGIEPGVLIAPLRFHGSAQVPGLGEVLSFGTNYGQAHLFTADGMYIDRVFSDSRRGDLWRFTEPPTPETLANTTLGQEHFGGSFQRARGADGSEHDLYVVAPGSPQCAVVELHGLDRVRRISGSSITVTAAHRAEAEDLRRNRMAEELAPKRYTVRRQSAIVIDGTDDDWQGDRIADFRLGYDERMLYVHYRGRDRRAPFVNAATRDNFHQAFTKGDVLDVMLETSPGRSDERLGMGRGDIRLSFAALDGQPAAILYDAVVPGANKGHEFSSPWRSVRIDQVRLLDEAEIVVRREGEDVILEAAIPLDQIHLAPKPGLSLRGDVGRVVSDQTGTTRSDRRYWSNPDTRVVSDVPSEAILSPKLWGTFTFE